MTKLGLSDYRNFWSTVRAVTSDSESVKRMDGSLSEGGGGVPAVHGWVEVDEPGAGRRVAARPPAGRRRERGAHINAEFTSQRNPDRAQPEAPGVAALVPVRLNALALPVEWLMVETRIVDAALIPWLPVPTLIRLPLIWSALISPLVVISAIVLRAVSAVITLAVLPARLSGVS